MLLHTGDNFFDLIEDTDGGTGNVVFHPPQTGMYTYMQMGGPGTE